MSIEHSKPGEIINIAPFGIERLAKEKSVALFKSKDLEVIRLVMPAKALMPLHYVSGEITIQCIEGIFEVSTPHRSKVIKPNQMLFLEGGEPHTVRAIEASSILLTIVLKQNHLDGNEGK